LFCLNDGEILPLTIHDKPTMPVRGFSDDISRGQISTMENFKDIIRRLSYVKCNVYMPYIEDTFAFERYPESGKYSDPVSPQEWKVLIRYAEDYYIDIIPIFNTMGHWDKNAKLEYFYPYVMKRNGGENGYPASSVDVRKPEAQRMIYDMLDELVDVFGKKGIHVGGDEVADYTSIFEKDLGNTITSILTECTITLTQKGSKHSCIPTCIPLYTETTPSALSISTICLRT
jgi:hypothetical protein